MLEVIKLVTASRCGLTVVAGQRQQALGSAPADTALDDAGRL